MRSEALLSAGVCLSVLFLALSGARTSIAQAVTRTPPPEFRLSPYWTVRWKQSETSGWTALPYPHLNSYLLTPKGIKEEPTQVWVTPQGNDDKTRGMEEVRKDWGLAIEMQKNGTPDGSLKNLGCRSVRKGLILCHAEGAGPRREWIYERMYWRRGRGKLVVQSRSKTSLADARASVNALQWVSTEPGKTKDFR